MQITLSKPPIYKECQYVAFEYGKKSFFGCITFAVASECNQPYYEIRTPSDGIQYADEQHVIGLWDNGKITQPAINVEVEQSINFLKGSSSKILNFIVDFIDFEEFDRNRFIIYDNYGWDKLHKAIEIIQKYKLDQYISGEDEFEPLIFDGSKST